MGYCRHYGYKFGHSRASYLHGGNQETSAPAIEMPLPTHARGRVEEGY